MHDPFILQTDPKESKVCCKAIVQIASALLQGKAEMLNLLQNKIQ